MKHWRAMAAAVLTLVVCVGAAPRAAEASAAVDWKLALIRAQELGDKQNYDAAVPAALAALDIAEKRFGPDHLFTLKSVNLLAELYHHQGNEAAAAAAEDRSLRIRVANAWEDLRKTQRRFGVRHRVTSGALMDLALLQSQMNKSHEAQELLEEALAIRERTEGPEHPDVAVVLDQLADVDQDLGEDELALAAILRSLHIRQASFGPDAPETVDTVTRLGEYYVGAGDLVTAEFYYQHALNAMRKTPRGRTMAVVPLLMSLAQLHSNRNQNERAASLLAEALAIQEKLLGPTHPDLADTLNLQAAAAINLNRNAEAEKFLRREFQIFAHNGEETSRDAAACLESLSDVYAAQRQNVKAETALSQALEIREKILGRSNPELLGYIYNLAEFNMTLGDQEKAEKLFLRIVAVPVAPNDSNAQMVADALENLGNIAAAKNETERAEEHYQAAAELLEKTLGPAHPKVAVALDTLAAFYISQARLDEATPLLRRALAIQEAALGKGNLELATTLSRLGEVCHYTGAFQESAKYYLRALQIRETLLGPDHPDVAVTLNDLALMYHTVGNRPKAEKLYRQALAILKKLYGDEHPLTLVVKGNLDALLKNQEP